MLIAGVCAASADTSVRLWRARGEEDVGHATAAYGADEVAVLEVGSMEQLAGSMEQVAHVCK